MNYSTTIFKNLGICVAIIILFLGCAGPEGKYFSIRVVDQETDRGVPLVKFISMTRNIYISDSQGMIAFREPGLMDREVYFVVESDGYEMSMTEDGKRSILLDVKAGKEVTVSINRTLPAERLYRLTGLGIYRDSHLLGMGVPIKNPLISGGVLGQDSQLGTQYKGKYFWIWGDTFLPPRYIGNFAVSAATSSFEDDPDRGINYNYFVDHSGYSRSMIDPQGPGYVWFDWLMTVTKGNEEVLLAKFGRVNGYWANVERGIARFNDEREIFERVKETPEWTEELTTMGHPFVGIVDGESYYFPTSEFRFSRVKRNYEDIINPGNYESFTCLLEGSIYDLSDLQLDRDENGNLVYGWKMNTDAIDYRRQEELIKEGIIKPGEGWIQITDLVSGEKEVINRGSVFWNEYRQKWIMIASGMPLGEVWYAEADTPIGPWSYAVKVADHINAFYNPKQHPYFDKDNGKQIYFEGTYTKGWRPEASITPYYHYNQVMYTLHLDREDVMIPEPVYRTERSLQFLPTIQHTDSIKDLAFFAYPTHRARSGLTPVYLSEAGRLNVSGSGNRIFYALPVSWDRKEGWTGISDHFLKGFELFESFFKADYAIGESDVDFLSNTENFHLSEQRIVGDSVFMTLVAFGKSYSLHGSIQLNKIIGRWTSTASEYEGDWEAFLNTDVWWAKYSDKVVPLYEFTDGKRFVYSTSDKLEESGYTRNSDPVCLVWKNPFDQMITDFTIKPN